MNIELIGERLKKIRQEKGLTLEDLHKKTRVHLNILKAIEGETLTNLSPVYLKGFIKIYCKALGLDPKEYIPDYKEASSGIILTPHQDSHSFLKSASIKISSLRPNKKIRGIIIIALIILAFLAVLLKVAGCLSLGRHPAVSLEMNQGGKLKTSLKAKTQTLASRPRQASAAKFPQEVSGGMRLVVSAKEKCLIFVKIDGRVVFHRVLEKGRSDSWKAKERIDLSLGDASAVEIVVNGQRFTNLGKKGQSLKNIVITEKDGLRILR
ncbi:MAG: hypothetical protein COT38_01270 [Candidatus Omnitrophica bacterium CG08_land_8_20_14_0_20_41_16]|uniref:Cytoskeleton protein RodZ-like C-terminal domain-containing protein n=1 Tax=Candidatus Sherwoodlollariibacterium unditelluris TaxID=1974757 RepID=A0A2G9YHZ3_9BACT|nr:MAG: hypothetical protein COX41_06240 [Candidatus Omnitrophica bacterium CG23_combo_of_CG06-09_8_20_14_all_41_10]PIS34222.1 MAG: hypothetical protein COT38_01270 [Candidatus Omnitrophica bacterium CG08_land_8_20_14_0_20_41_16]